MDLPAGLVHDRHMQMPEPASGPQSPEGEDGLLDRARSFAAGHAWDRVVALLGAAPPRRFSPELASLLAEAAAWTRAGDAAQKAATAAIRLDMLPAQRAAIATHLAAGGEHLLAWLVLTADPRAVVAPEVVAKVAATLARVADRAEEPALRAAGSEARRRLLDLSGNRGERLAERPGPPPAPPPRAASLRILRAPDVPEAAEAVFRDLEAAFEQQLVAGAHPAVRVYRDVFVNAAGQVWDREGHQVVAGLRLGLVRPLEADARRLRDRAPELEAAEFAARPADANFFHWMLNRFPTFHRYAEAGTPLPLIVAGDSPAFLDESLAAASLPLRLLRPAPAVFVHMLYFSVQELAALAAPAGGLLHDRLMAAADAAAPAVPCGPLIYVSRRDSRRRGMENEAELEQALARLGLRAVSFSGLPLLEQIRIIRGARLVVAPHGAGLAHLAFARPGTTVLELMPLVSRPQARIAMAQISRMRGHRHTLWLATTTPGGETWRTDIAALLPEVERLCREAGA